MDFNKQPCHSNANCLLAAVGMLNFLLLLNIASSMAAASC